MLLDVLRTPVSALPYAALLALRQASPGAFWLETADAEFGWQPYARAGLCVCTPKPDCPPELIDRWDQTADRSVRVAINGFFDVRWQGRNLELLQLQYDSPSCGTLERVWVGAADEATATDFFAAVSRWSTALREEVYVYQEGYWQKDSVLYTSVRASQLDNLILPPGLKEAIRDDAATFFAASDRYRRFGVPWKRGLILIGPPGNGKSHMIQGLINDLDRPCLYVKSLKSRYQNEDRSIREVFDKARESAPCILVLEDIDALIDAENRSFFLNELDGFRKNDGLLTIATTNHPERLDPAIVDRPSRFDRKYHFDLPAAAERAAYLRWWNGRLDGALRLTEAGLETVADATAGFSFAYLKELALAAVMAWMDGRGGPMDEVMLGHVAGLRAQMTSAPPHADPVRPQGE